MTDCRDLDALLTPYVDGEVTAEQCAAIEAHLRTCPPCQRRADAEAGARTVLRRCRDRLREPAPATLHAACRKLAVETGAAQASVTAASAATTVPASPDRGIAGRPDHAHAGAASDEVAGARRAPRPIWQRWGPLSLAATVVLAAAGVLLYGLGASSRALAQQLATDHVRCVRFVGDTPGADRAEMAERWKQARGWTVALPPSSASDDLQFVALRRCRHAGGELAHALYRHQGHLVSLFIFPDGARRPANVEIMGQHAAIWSQNGRTYAVIAAASPDEVDRLKTFFARSVE